MLLSVFLLDHFATRFFIRFIFFFSFETELFRSGGLFFCVQRQFKVRANKLCLIELFVEFNVNSMSKDCREFHSIKMSIVASEFFHSPAFKRPNWSHRFLVHQIYWGLLLFVIKWHAFEIYTNNDQSIVWRTFLFSLKTNKKRASFDWYGKNVTYIFKMLPLFSSSIRCFSVPAFFTLYSTHKKESAKMGD